MRESPKMSTCSKKKIDLWLMVEKFQKDEAEIVVIAKQASLQHYHKVSSAYQCCQAILATLCSTALGSNVMATLIGRDHFTIMLNVPTRFQPAFPRNSGKTFVTPLWFLGACIPHVKTGCSKHQHVHATLDWQVFGKYLGSLSGSLW